jgi:hypothetical protein
MSDAINPRAVYDRYLSAWQAHGEECERDPSIWHRPDVAEFTELRRLLAPCAEAGDMFCQYALATIFFLGLCFESENEYAAGYAAATEEATRWWIAASKQGYWPALDNLAVSGLGAEAERAREAWRQLERDRPDLVGWCGSMPVYAGDFVQELSRRLYGRVVTEGPKLLENQIPKGQ